MSYMPQIYRRCSNTLLTPYLQPCTYQFPQRTPYISTGICVLAYRNYSAHYDINTRYLGVTKDVTMGVELSPTQFQICQQANGQFCHISTPFQPLANPPTCIAALYTKSKASIASKCSLQLCKTTTITLPTQITPDVWILTTPATAPLNMVTLICQEKPMETIQIKQPIHILKLPMACSATSSHFYLPPRYETPP